MTTTEKKKLKPKNIFASARIPLHRRLLRAYRVADYTTS